jgi:hypothetical protein
VWEGGGAGALGRCAAWPPPTPWSGDRAWACRRSSHGIHSVASHMAHPKGSCRAAGGMAVRPSTGCFGAARPCVTPGSFRRCRVMHRNGGSKRCRHSRVWHAAARQHSACHRESNQESPGSFHSTRQHAAHSCAFMIPLISSRIYMFLCRVVECNPVACDEAARGVLTCGLNHRCNSHESIQYTMNAQPGSFRRGSTWCAPWR